MSFWLLLSFNFYNGKPTGFKYIQQEAENETDNKLSQTKITNNCLLSSTLRVFSHRNLARLTIKSRFLLLAFTVWSQAYSEYPLPGCPHLRQQSAMVIISILYPLPMGTEGRIETFQIWIWFAQVLLSPPWNELGGTEMICPEDIKQHSSDLKLAGPRAP